MSSLLRAKWWKLAKTLAKPLNPKKIMAMSPSRLILTGLRLVARQLCTISVEAGAASSSYHHRRSPRDPDQLYRRLSVPRGTMAQTLDEYVREGNEIRRTELIRCVKALRKYNRIRPALEIMEWMEERKMNFSHAEHAIHIDLIAKRKGIAAAENYLNGIPPSAHNMFTLGALLNCYCNEPMYDKALAVFKEMEDMNFLHSSLPFNNIMTLHMRLAQPEKVPLVVHHMKQKWINLDTISYNIWMQSYGCLNDIEGAERVLEQMKKDRQVRVDWTAYSHLAAIYVKAGLHEKAESALKELEFLIQPRRDREPYHFLISLYGGMANRNEVYRVWDSLKSKFKTTLNKSYLLMLQTLAKLRDIEGLKTCFEEWESSCLLEYDMKLANVAMKACLEHGMYEEAVRIFDYALMRSNGPFFRAREMFMVYLLRNHQLDLALNHLKAIASEAKEHKWQPKQETTNAFFGYFKKEKDVDGAEMFCKILKCLNLLDSKAFIFLLKTYLAAGRLAPGIRHRLQENDVEITDELQTLLNGVCPE